MMIKESTIKNIVKKHVINEMAEATEEQQHPNISSGYPLELKNSYMKTYIPENGIGRLSEPRYVKVFPTSDDKLAHILVKLRTLKNKANSANVNLTWEIEESMDKLNNKKYTVIVKATQPEIKVDGYKFIGGVYPIMLPQAGKKNFAMVTPSPEFEDNFEIIKQIENTASRGTCDGCHRTSDRGSYYMFLDKEGNIKKFGGTCASKYFGIDISNALVRLLNGLHTLGEDPYVIESEWSDGDRYDRPVLDNDSDRFHNLELAVCMLLADEGLDTQIKGNVMLSTYENLLDDYNSLCWAVQMNQKDSEYSLKMFLDNLRKKFPKFFELKEKGTDMFYDFHKNVVDFYINFEPKSTFDLKLKETGLFLGGGLIQKKKLGKVSSGVVPYVLTTYFKTKAGDEDKKVYNVLGSFSGEKKLDVKIESVAKGTSRYSGNTYYRYCGVTSNMEKVQWFEGREMDGISRGSQITIYAQFKDMMNDEITTMLQYVKTEANKKREEEKMKDVPPYPEDGYRYKKEQFTFVKLSGDYFIVRDSQGHEYYVRNLEQGYGYYAVPYQKWPSWTEQFSIDKPTTLSGTVASYNKRDGSKGYKLMRVKFHDYKA